MTDSNDAIDALRKSLESSPKNIPLRQHVAESLLKLSRTDEAEAEYREAIALAPNNADLYHADANNSRVSRRA